MPLVAKFTIPFVRLLMNQEKKLEKILDRALTEDLEDYTKLLKVLKKRLPFFGGTKRIAAALLKEVLEIFPDLTLNP
jgi:hypothetical protein